MKRIPSLDGFRAISIILVILSHLIGEATYPLAQRLIWRFDIGNIGVRVFFVISGFLITSLLIKEHVKSGTIKLGSFYFRRLFRIAPAYCTMLLVVSLLIPLNLASATYYDLLKAFLYLSNYLHINWAVGHTWSLAVEEQFYLLWPGLLIILGLRRAAYAAALSLLLSPTFRILADCGLWPPNPRYAFETVSDALATGCLLALLRDYLWKNATYNKLLKSRFFIALPIVVLAWRATQPPELVWDAIGITVLNLTIGITLDRYMRFDQTIGGRILNVRALTWIGTLSYSLYLWQQLFLDGNHPLPPILSVPLILLAACCSYYFIELPCLRARKRISRPS